MPDFGDAPEAPAHFFGKTARTTAAFGQGERVRRRHLAPNPRRVPDELAATADEVRAALADLSDADLLRLEKYATWRVRRVPVEKRERRDGEALLRLAIDLTLEGTRRWHKRQGIVHHLEDVMSSVANHWAKRPVTDTSILACELARDRDDGTTIDPLAEVPSQEPSPERQALARDLLAQVEALCNGDARSSLVLQGLREGLTDREIADALGITEGAVQESKRKIYTRARRAFPEGKGL